MIRFEEALERHQAFDDATDQDESEDHIVEVEILIFTDLYELIFFTHIKAPR